jgi:hypothetical protein
MRQEGRQSQPSPARGRAEGLSALKFICSDVLDWTISAFNFLAGHGSIPFGSAHLFPGALFLHSSGHGLSFREPVSVCLGDVAVHVSEMLRVLYAER